MGFRTIVIESRCRLECSLNYMVCKKENENKRIFLDEINIIIINTSQVTITAALVSVLIEKKIKIIFTDSKHNPVGEIVPYVNNYYAYRKIKEQINFSQERKGYLWKRIIEEKLSSECRILRKVGRSKESLLVNSYIKDVELGDVSNREGHGAKVYFNSLFGNGYSRRNDSVENSLLNYGYAILLSTINREIKSLGYLTEIGIHHIGESNSFNFSCDLIEPLRCFVDNYVLCCDLESKESKKNIVKLLTNTVRYNNKEFIFSNAIHLYVEDLINYLISGDVQKIKFIEYEL